MLPLAGPGPILCCSTSIHSHEWRELQFPEPALHAQYPDPRTLCAAGIWALLDDAFHGRRPGGDTGPERLPA